MRARTVVAAVVVVWAVFGLAGAAAAQEEGAQEEVEHELTHEAEECIHVLEEGGSPEDCHEAPNPILPETNEIIWGGLAFFTLLGLMWKWALPPVQRMLQQRTERIRESLDQAEKTRSEAQALMDDYQRQLADARNESNRIIEEARQTADQLRRDLTQRAEAEAAELRQRAQEDIASAQQRAVADLQTQVRELAIELAEKVVERSLDRDTNMALIDSYIRQVESSR